MSDQKSQAEVFVYGLVHGLVTPDEVGRWAEGLLSATPAPESWIIELCTGEERSPKELIATLHTVPGASNPADVNAGVNNLLTRKNKPFELFAPELLPPSFVSPLRLVQYARTGHFPYDPSVWFIDAASSHARSLLRHVRDVNPLYVPFAKVGDRFLSFDSSAKNGVVVVDIVERIVAQLESAASWFDSYEQRANEIVWHLDVPG
ncbi:hypothetical protein [Dyella sp. C11]|uniref:hypothetical protein n=1 Tax=Dyella sp. C11 TaxID=2126991 RepID=UPI001300533E|nr:hypothetical protein [Dyella sp. C11]